MSTELTVQRDRNRTMLEGVKDRLLATIPKEVDRGRFLAISQGVVCDPNLVDCTPNSLMMSIYNCARLGLVPDYNTGHIWILPYKNRGRKEAQVQVGYKGRIELARRSGNMSNVWVDAVYANDKWECRNRITNDYTHIPWHEVGAPEPGELIKTYCVATYTDGHRHIQVASMHDIQQSKARSKSAKYGKGPWTTDFEAMALTVPIRMAWRTWPQTPEMGLAARLDHAADAEEPQYTPLEEADILDGEAMDDGSFGFGDQPLEADDADDAS